MMLMNTVLILVVCVYSVPVYGGGGGSEPEQTELPVPYNVGSCGFTESEVYFVDYDGNGATTDGIDMAKVTSGKMDYDFNGNSETHCTYRFVMPSGSSIDWLTLDQPSGCPLSGTHLAMIGVAGASKKWENDGSLCDNYNDGFTCESWRCAAANSDQTDNGNKCCYMELNVVFRESGSNVYFTWTT